MACLPLSTRDQWLQLESRLAHPMASAELLADDIRIVIQVERISSKSLSYGYVVYINGVIKWKHTTEPDALALKFWAKRVISLWSPAKKASILKGLPKRQQKSLIAGLGLEKTRDIYEPTFRSFSALRAQFKRSCACIEWVNAPEVTQ